MPIPSIETERLILRGYAPDDFEAFAAIWADPDNGAAQELLASIPLP